MNDTQAEFWAKVNAPVPAPEESVKVEDFSGMSMDEYAGYRAGRVKDMSNVQGITADNPVEHARQVAQMFQPKAMPDDMAAHEEARRSNGIKDASDIFGAARSNPRSHRSPYSV